MKAILLFLSIFIILTGVTIAQDFTSELIMPDMSALDYNSLKKGRKMSDEATIEAYETYFLETMFSDVLSSQSMSILTEEEKAEFGAGVDTSIQDDMAKKEFMKILAKRDILGLKKSMLKKKNLTR